jgi:glycosyltransferase involved in cell wall biosynthesis
VLNLIHIIESLSDYGGTPRKLLYLCQHIEQRECRQVFFCYYPSDLRKEFERCGAIVDVIAGSSLTNITRNAISLARRYGANVICSHFTRPLMAGYLAALATGLPIIHNEHSSAYYRRGVGRRIAKIILPRVQAITCNSHYTKSTILKEFSVPPEKLSVFYDPVVERKSSLSRQELRREFGITDDDLVIGHVGGMIPQRDQNTLIQAIASVRRRYDKTRLLLIGDGPKRAELESLVSALGIEGVVAFVGYTDRIGDYLKVMDIYVNPTLDEGFGIAVVEAMLAGLPVVLANAGAHPELVHDGTSGFLYQGGDAEALASIIERLTASLELREIIGTAAQARAMTNFSPERYSKAFLSHAVATVETFNASASSFRRKGWRWNGLS